MHEHATKDYSRAILHFDGDSFFASVEQALNHTLRGKVVITGGERGAVTAVSIEGKRLGLGRGLSLRQIRSECPEAVVVSSDYISYGIFARRMYALVRRHAPIVEEYSIDECFADITGLARPGRSYEDIAQDIHRELERALGITFGVGLAPSKVLAKVASKHRKPGGFTAIAAPKAAEFLAGMHIGQVWGIGPAMAQRLNAIGIQTALDFAGRTPEWLRANHIAKPYRAIWHELRGISVSPVSASVGEPPASIIKSRTFSPPSKARTFVYSQLALNVDRACARARRAGVLARRLSFHLKTQEFLYGRVELDLSSPTNNPADILRAIHPRFDVLFKEGVEYRATGISLGGLVPAGSAPLDLFSQAEEVQEQVPLLRDIDALNRRFGAGTVYAGSSMTARLHRAPDRRKRAAKRLSQIEMGSTLRRKRLDLPFLGTAQ